VLADHADIAKDLHSRLVQWLTEIGAPEAAISVYR
jgi:hypothetical protein